MSLTWGDRAKKVVYGCALLFLLFLSSISLFYSSDRYVVSVNSGKMFLLHLLAGILFLGICWIAAYFIEKAPKACRVAGVCILFVFSISFSAWWIVNSAYMPQSDVKSIYDIAFRAKNHDLLPIAPTGSYMSLCPHQSGLVLFFETVFRTIPDADEKTIQWIYLFLMAISLISAYMVVRRMFSLTRTRIFWCILMCFCFPYYFYVNNMYGEIPSIALTFFTLWMLLDYLHDGKWGKVIIACLTLAGAVAVRKNTIIFVIACVLVFAVLFLMERKKRYIAVTFLLIISAAGGMFLPRSFYEIRAKNTMGEGIPATAYIAMGLQWSDGRSPGGWNGYHSDLYMKCDYDAERTAKISTESIKQSLRYMAENPTYAVKFFFFKALEQWAREDCTCLYATMGTYGERTQAAWDLYEGRSGERAMFMMAAYQSVIYFGAAIFCMFGLFNWIKRKKHNDTDGKRGEMQNLILLVTFIGGFLFSLMWEAGSRYILPYYVMLIPYAADGWARASRKMELRVRKMNSKKLEKPEKGL